MGLMKRMLEEMESRGWDEVPNKLVCDECLDDEVLQEFVRAGAEPGGDHCDYCGRTSRKIGISIPVDQLMEPIAAAVYYHFEELGGEYWDNEDGRYWVGEYDPRDVLEDLGWPFSNEELSQDIVNAFGDRIFCERDPMTLSRQEALLYGWQGFVEHVLHKSRFVFLNAAKDKSDWDDPEAIPPGLMLDEIASIIRDWDSLTPQLPGGTRLIRAVPHTEAEIPYTAKRLGSPPVDRTRSTRMSPVGISMFYASTDSKTAAAEILAHLGDDATECYATTAEFILARDIYILNLTKLPAIPSPFDESATRTRPALRFLHHFADEVSKPVDRTDREIVEYVPTQIVTDYVRHIFTLADSETRVQGIVYRSAARPEGHSIVLFFDNEACIELTDGWEQDRSAWLALDPASPQTKEFPNHPR
jgi:hypothetical protein